MTSHWIELKKRFLMNEKLRERCGGMRTDCGGPKIQVQRSILKDMLKKSIFCGIIYSSNYTDLEPSE